MTPVAALDTTIRAAEERDLDDVAAIERSLFKDPWSRRSFDELVDSAQVTFLVAATEDGIVGYAVVLQSGLESELANLAVSQLVQRRGLGRRLLQAALKAAQARGSVEMFLEVRASNAGAIALYRSAGLSAVGRRARYYARPTEDAVIMRAPLSRSPGGEAVD